MSIKSRDEWLNEGHSYDKEIDNARMMQGSASELVQWAERKIAESRPENFKEGVISPVTEASRWKGKEIFPNWVKPSDIEGFVKKESDLEVGRDYVLYEPGMDSWQAEYTYKGKIKGEYTFTSSAQFSTSPDERFTRKELDAMIKGLELAVMESINENVKDAAFNLDKIFPEDEESIMQFQDIEDNGTVEDMIEYINVHGNEEMLSRYGIRNDRDVKKLAKHIMRESVNEAAPKFLKKMKDSEYVKIDHMGKKDVDALNLIFDDPKMISDFKQHQRGKKSRDVNKLTKLAKPFGLEIYVHNDFEEKDGDITSTVNGIDVIGNKANIERFRKEILEESVNESLTGKLKALYKAAQKAFGKTKIVPPNDADYETAEKYIEMEYGKGHSLFAIGVDKIQDVINIQVGDDKTRETEDIVIDRPATNEAVMKGKYAGNKLKSAIAGKTLTMDGKTYTALGKGKWKGPDGEKLSWVEVSAMASALGDKEVTYEAEVNEAKMDKRFQKDWEKSCAALINHLEYELKTKRLGGDKGIVEQMVHNLKVVQQYPKLMSHIFGTNESVNEADWSDDVKTKWTPPKGLFAETTPPNKIADTLFKASKDLDQAMSRLMFYINRGGKLLSPKAKANLEVAKKMLQKKYQ